MITLSGIASGLALLGMIAAWLAAAWVVAVVVFLLVCVVDDLRRDRAVRNRRGRHTVIRSFWAKWRY